MTRKGETPGPVTPEIWHSHVYFDDTTQRCTTCPPVGRNVAIVVVLLLVGSEGDGARRNGLGRGLISVARHVCARTHSLPNNT